MSPRVSIVVNNFNYGRFLREAIDSALAQTYPNVEVIVVDDGSTDDSREIIASYGGKILPVLKKNGGQASAFNAGWKHAGGEIVIFLDADDYLYPNACERVSSVDITGVCRIHFLMDVVDSSSRRCGRLPASGSLREGQADNPVRMGLRDCVPTSGNAFVKSASESCFPVDERLTICADAMLLLTNAQAGRIQPVYEVLAAYRIHGSNSYKAVGYFVLDEKRSRARVYGTLGKLLAGRTHLDGAVSSRELIRRFADHRSVKDLLMGRLAGSIPSTFPELTDGLTTSWLLETFSDKAKEDNLGKLRRVLLGMELRFVAYAPVPIRRLWVSFHNFASVQGKKIARILRSAVSGRSKENEATPVSRQNQEIH